MRCPEQRRGVGLAGSAEGTFACGDPACRVSFSMDAGAWEGE